MTGIVYKSIGGFYYVKTADGVLIECKPRGIFRKDGIRIVAGDKVELAEEAGTVFIDALLPRRNVFVRPPVANVDQFLFVVSTTQPTPNFLVIDKLTVVASDGEANAAIILTKTDIEDGDTFAEAYRTSDIPVLRVNGQTGEGVDKVKDLLQGKLSVLCGNSGVGKSTLLNALLPAALQETAAISHKLGRGKHTTREVEIFEVGGGLLADTPGFASFDLQQVAPVCKENLQFDFPEIARYIDGCKFTGCTHVAEKGCAVRKALEAGEISASRYESYVTLYQQAKESEPY